MLTLKVKLKLIIINKCVNDNKKIIIGKNFFVSFFFTKLKKVFILFIVPPLFIIVKRNLFIHLLINYVDSNIL